MERINMINVIPESASLAEGAFYVIESVENAYNEMWREIGISELHSLEETGNMVIYEAESEAAEKTKKSFKQWINDFWAKVKGLINKFLEEAKSLADKAKGKLNALGVKTKDNVKKMLDKKLAGQGLKHGKTYGKAYEWGKDFTDGTEFNGPIWDSIRAYDSWFSKIESELNAYRNNPAATKSNLNMAKTLTFKNLNLKENASMADVQTAVLNKMRGAEVTIDDKYIRDHFDEMWEYATDFSKTSAKVKKVLNGNKKAFDDAAKKIAKFNRKESDLKVLIQSIKESRTILVHITNGVLRAIRERMSISIRIILRVSMLAKAKEEAKAKEKSVGESFTGSDIAAQITGLFA